MKPALLSFVKGFTDPSIPSVVALNLSSPLCRLFRTEYMQLSHHDLTEKCEEEASRLAFSTKQVAAQEKTTRLQSKSNTWFEYRAGRITASNFRAAVSTNPVSPSVSLIKRICYPEAYLALQQQVTISEEEITTDLHTKPTDKHQYLLRNSAHHKHCKQGIPYGQFLRLRRICSSTPRLKEKAAEFRQHFQQRGVEEALLDDAITRAQERPLEETLKEKEPTTPQERAILFHQHEEGYSSISPL
uniref:Uncharacterized protein n=1 Tax=Branchiostoma floridae TaxID=7739 RepID=C3YY93_BRAFL|eukprot:XP_002598700.1 hypothetical protein BRAFLDRAFT_95816 [Branchiostoma floridae]